MIGRVPEPIRGTDPMSNWLNRLRQSVLKAMVSDSSDIRVVPGTHGTTLEITRFAAAGKGKAKQYRLKEVLADTLRCRAFDGTNEDSTDVYIAKPYKLRRTPFDGQTIAFDSDGESFSAHYVYSSPTKRTSTIAGTDEVQIVVPRFRVNADLIYAIECDGLNLTDPAGGTVTLLDLNEDGRAFAGPAS